MANKNQPNHQPLPVQRSFSRPFLPARDFSATAFPVEVQVNCGCPKETSHGKSPSEQAGKGTGEGKKKTMSELSFADHET